MSKPKKKKLLKREIRAELQHCLEIALYDLSNLNRHDPFYVPRCEHRAKAILAECGVTEIQAYPNVPLVIASELLPQVVTLLRALLAEKPPVYKSPQVSFHASNLINYLAMKGVQVVPKPTDATRGVKKKTKVSKARKKVRSKLRASKPTKRTR